jgi:hypothetical protein
VHDRHLTRRRPVQYQTHGCHFLDQKVIHQQRAPRADPARSRGQPPVLPA